MTKAATSKSPKRHKGPCGDSGVTEFKENQITAIKMNFMENLLMPRDRNNYVLSNEKLILV